MTDASKAQQSKGLEKAAASLQKPFKGGANQLSQTAKADSKQQKMSGNLDLQDILAEDTKNATKNASKANLAPVSTVLLRPIDPVEPSHSTKKFQD